MPRRLLHTWRCLVGARAQLCRPPISCAFSCAALLTHVAAVILAARCHDTATAALVESAPCRDDRSACCVRRLWFVAVAARARRARACFRLVDCSLVGARQATCASARAPRRSWLSMSGNFARPPIIEFIRYQLLAAACESPKRLLKTACAPQPPPSQCAHLRSLFLHC